ncbi:MAG: ATP-binding cassette domain-containing protein, partial [Treponema sp.]|nr:ATP-binding cassette domain-containing protein [Treponema sp.]
SLDELKALRKNTDKNETALLAENLSFSYGEEKIFSGVNLELKKGSLISLTGKSGCGKSTLFECLCGLLKPETGNLYAEKRPALALQESEASLFEKFAADDVAFGAIKKGLEGKELLERVKSSMELAGLSWTEYRDKPVFYLSGGEKRKVSIASIFALGNDIMIFDEPTSALDPASRKNILKAFRKLTDEGKTILFSTHRPEEQMAADVNLKWEDLINQNEALKKEVSRPLPELSQIKNAGLITSARKLSSSFSSPAERKKSPVSKFPPVVRFLIFLTLFFSSLFTTSIPATSVCLSSSVLYTFFCRSPFFKPLKTFIKILPFVIFLAVIQFLFFPSSESDIVLLKLKFFTLTDTKLLFIAHVILRAMTAVFAVSTFLNITSERDFTDALKDFLKPLTLIKIPVRYLITVVTVVFRFMPLMLDDFILIIKTQIIRGSYADAKGIKKIKMLVSLLAPLLLHSFRKAQFLADALTARHFK